MNLLKLSRRQLLTGASALGLCVALEFEPAIAAAPAVSDYWMETPDVLALSIEDGSIVPGNIVQLSEPDPAEYDRWILRVNPRSGNREYCMVIGPDKKHLRFSDQIAPAFVDRLALRKAEMYSVASSHGLKVTSVYWRDEPIGQGQFRSNPLLMSMRHIVYLQLSGVLVQGEVYKITHAGGAISHFELTYDDKRIRAGGIKTSSAGHKPSDAFKQAYLCSRLPAAPEHGAVDFDRRYGFKRFEIINESGRAVFQGDIKLRRAWDQLEADDGYTTGIDVADLAQSWTVTGVTRGNPTIVRCPGHPFANGDKVRFRGMSGMRQLEGIGATGAHLWIAASVKVVDRDSFAVNIDSTKFSNLTRSDYDSTLGGVLNQVYRCFTTNRAATNVWGLDYSAFRPKRPGKYRIYISGYGVSDPIPIDESAWARVAAAQHHGMYNLRLGCAIIGRKSFSREIALKDGVNGCTNYWSTLPSIFASEFSSNYFGPRAKSGFGAYAERSGVGPGFITNRRALGSRPGHQDAGDNDDIGADHLSPILALAWLFHELPHEVRYLPFEVQRSSELLDPALFAGTDKLPPLFHELAWHLEAYRTQQSPDGSAPGGWGIGHTGAQVPNYPEPIQYYRGTDARGIYSGQKVMAFLYAPDHYTGMLLAAAFGKFAQIAYDYKLSRLGDAYKHAATLAYQWADRLLSDRDACDAYYIGHLKLKAKMNWTDAAYRAAMEKVNRATRSYKNITCGVMYRLLGSREGQTPYGDHIDAHLGAMNGHIGGWDYIMTPGSKPGVRRYCLGHAFDGLDVKHQLSSETCFNSTLGAHSTSGGTTLVNPQRLIQAHMSSILVHGARSGHDSPFLKVLQAGLAFMLGANQPGKAFMTGFGPRPYRCILHEDSYKMGVPAPEGITPFGYFAWATGLIVFNFASGPNCDGPLDWIADNVSGRWESPPNSGSHKMENPWRFGTGYWEWAPENKGLIFQSEFALAHQINSLISSLYLHGWDAKAAAGQGRQ